MAVKLRPVNLIGMAFYHRFVDSRTGIVTDVRCKQTEYEALALPGAGQPTAPVGSSWVLSMCRQFCDQGDGTILPGDAVFNSAGDMTVIDENDNFLGYLSKKEYAPAVDRDGNVTILKDAPGFSIASGILTVVDTRATKPEPDPAKGIPPDPAPVADLAVTPLGLK